jgi:hypothetical protein
MITSSEPTQRPWNFFFGWFLVGVLWMLTIAGIASIGIIVLPAALATWLMIRRQGPRFGMLGLITVGALPFFLLARLNRNTQGTVLHGTGGGPVTGFVTTNSWPWVVVGALFVVASIVAFIIATRPQR